MDFYELWARNHPLLLTGQTAACLENVPLTLYVTVDDI